MPAYRLEAAPAGDGIRSVAQVESAVLGFLSGLPIATAAAGAGITTATLADAVQEYQAAGRAALTARAHNGRWYQATITFTDWATAEDTVTTALWPRLQEAETGGLVSSWWYIRKAPCWRLRLHPTADTSSAQLRRFIGEVLDRMAARRLIAAWSPGRYEPESAAFGGAMNLAHQLFHADSTNILAYLQRCRQPGVDPPIGRRELPLLLCSTLLRATGQEWHEQGDVWYRVTRMRPLPPQTPPTRVPELADSVRRLLMLDTTATTVAGPTGTLALAQPWFAAMTDAGHALAAGTLDRGLRDVLSHHVIFHWNRLGLPAMTQSTLAHSAQAAVMDHERGQ
jgi:thiopeptide-type bacteriocin biosynthesis protein